MEYDVLGGIRNPNVPQVAFGIIPFFRTETRNTGSFDENGQPIFKTYEVVEIHNPGDRKNNLHLTLKDDTKQRVLEAKGLWNHYLKWKESTKSNAALVDGTPIDQWPQISREQAELFKYNKIYTIQQLAAAHDGTLAALGAGAFQLRDLARKWTADLASRGGATMMAVEIDKLSQDLIETQRAAASKDDEIAKLKAMLADAKIGSMQSMQPSAPMPPAPEYEDVEEDLPPIPRRGKKETPDGFGDKAGKAA